MKSEAGASAASSLHKSRSAGRVLRLLDTVVSGGPLTLSEIAAHNDLPVSTALRHLRVLADHGYVTKRERGEYSAGPTFLRLALAAFQSGPYARLVAAAQPHLLAVAEASEESCYLAVLDGSEAVYIATIESPRAIRHVGWVGRSVPAVGTAVGDALTSPPAHPGTVPRAFENVGAIEADVTAVVAPIFAPAGVVGALSVLGPSERLPEERRMEVADVVTTAAAAVATDYSSPDELVEQAHLA